MILLFVQGFILWTVHISFTNPRTLPSDALVGPDAYSRLWRIERWYVAIQNLLIFGGLFIGVSLGRGHNHGHGAADGGAPHFLPLHAPSPEADRWLGQEMGLGIQPEATGRFDAGSAAGNPTLVRVDRRVSVLDRGRHHHLHPARIKPSDTPAEGSVAGFMIDRSRANLFDPKTERRI